MQAFPGSDVVTVILVPIAPGPSLVLKTLAYWPSVVMHPPAFAEAAAKLAIRARIIWYLIMVRCRCLVLWLKCKRCFNTLKP